MLSDTQRELLAARLRANRPAGARPIGRRPAELTEIPLSFAQEQLWFLDQFAPGLPTYNVPSRLRLRGPLDVPALNRAVCAVLARHESLRTRLVAGPHGRPVQLIDQPAPVTIELTELPDETALDQLSATEAARPFDLAGGPLFRLRLIRLSGTEHVLLMVMHHSVFDAWSYGVLLAELAELYRAELAGEPARLPELAVQFADYAVWERQRLQDAGQELIEHWRQALAGHQLLQLPTDRPRPVLESFRGGIERIRLGSEVGDGIRALGKREGSTGFVVLLAALQALLHRYTGQTDIVVGAPSANRGRSSLQPLIGFLVNTLPMRTDLSGDPTFAELLHRVRETTVAGYAHAELPFAKLVDALDVPRDPGRSPVFSVILTAADAPQPISAAGLSMQLEKVDLLAAKFDLAFFVETCPDGLWLEVAYASDLFDASTVGRLLGHYAELLTGALAAPASRLSQLPLLTEAELFAELVAWNDTELGCPGGRIEQLFAEQVRRRPDAIAAVCAAESISYRQLDRDANRVARWLRGLGVGPQVLVGLCLPPSIRRLAVLLGVLKAGGGYLPLDPALPADRLAFMVADAGAPIVLTDDRPELAGGQLPGTAQVLALAAEWARIAGLPDTEPELAGSAADVAYVIYTSGSTGRPKGVVLEHRQVVNFACGVIQSWPVTGADRVLQFASLNFDVSVLDMFCTLLAGATAVLADRETLLSPPRLAALMREQRVSLACLPPAVLDLLTGQPLPELRMLVSAGEELPTALARAWLRDGLRLVNGYGPTETTVLSLTAEVDGTSWPAPIGRPLPNYQAYVLDPDLNPMPVGVAGELHIGGPSVARGYLNRPELTAERFITDPFGADPDGRLYKTGDLVKRLPDGRIGYLGRLDGQIKLRGLRVELGEIEAALTSHPAVGQAVVVVREDRPGDKRLTGYLRRAEHAELTEPSVAELTELLAGWLPGYMIPDQLVWLAEFPLNTSGKLDRAALPAPAGRRSEPAGHAAPRTATEAALARLYAELLGMPPAATGPAGEAEAGVSVNDSFFDLGGNSLQAMQLISRIRTELGADLGVTAVFLAPSPRLLAGRLAAARTGPGQPADGGLVQQLSDGTGTEPLFLVHAVGGTVFGYAGLAAQLAEDYRVYGIQAAGLTGDPPAGGQPAGLAELASHYLAAIRQHQPAGPYRIGGWSMGGLLAHELTRQLELAGEQVRLLVLLDAPFQIEPDSASEAELADQFAADALRTLGRPVAEPVAGGSAGDGAATLDRLAGLLDPGAGQSTGTREQLHRRFAVFASHRRLMSGYRPAGAVHADTLLIGAEHSPNAAAQARWPELIEANLTTSTRDADHYSLLQPPQVIELAALIRAADRR